jgi:hypothetical protein
MVTLLEYGQAVLSRSSDEKQVDLDEEARA